MQELTGGAIGIANANTSTKTRKFVALTECYTLVVFRTRICSCDPNRSG